MARKTPTGSAGSRNTTQRVSARTPDWDELIPRICGRIAEGESLRAIVRGGDVPALSTIMKQLTLDAAFRDAYDLARTIQYEGMADELVDIADDARNDWMEVHGKNDTGWRVNNENVQRSRLRIDARKWVLSKMLPKKYGDLAANGGADTPNEQAKALKDLRDLMLTGKPDVDAPADT